MEVRTENADRKTWCASKIRILLKTWRLIGRKKRSFLRWSTESRKGEWEDKNKFRQEKSIVEIREEEKMKGTRRDGAGGKRGPLERRSEKTALRNRARPFTEAVPANYH